MNIGITTSFVIGGMLLLSILAFNLNLSNSTQETTVSTMNQDRMDGLVEVLNFDMDRLGYNPTDNYMYNALQGSSDDDMEFYVSYTETVRWYADTNAEVSSTTNPNDFLLYRVDESGAISEYPVTHFEVNYYVQDFSGDWNLEINPASESEITSLKIEVEILMESAEPIRSDYGDGQSKYHRTAWKRTYIPTNVNLKQWQ